MCTDVSEAASVLTNHFDPDDGGSMYLRNIEYNAHINTLKSPIAKLASILDHLSWSKINIRKHKAVVTCGNISEIHRQE
jgi:hypothetical protein